MPVLNEGGKRCDQTLSLTKPAAPKAQRGRPQPTRARGRERGGAGSGRGTASVKKRHAGIAKTGGGPC
eukprot:8955204-Pyramimonas_sp.AAC.1